jgi:hypothetical protein
MNVGPVDCLTVGHDHALHIYFHLIIQNHPHVRDQHSATRVLCHTDSLAKTAKSPWSKVLQTHSQSDKCNKFYTEHLSIQRPLLVGWLTSWLAGWLVCWLAGWSSFAAVKGFLALWINIITVAMVMLSKEAFWFLCRFVEKMHWDKRLFTLPWPAMNMYFYTSQQNLFLHVTVS